MKKEYKKYSKELKLNTKFIISEKHSSLKKFTYNNTQHNNCFSINALNV